MKFFFHRVNFDLDEKQMEERKKRYPPLSNALPVDLSEKRLADHDVMRRHNLFQADALPNQIALIAQEANVDFRYSFYISFTHY